MIDFILDVGAGLGYVIGGVCVTIFTLMVIGYVAIQCFECENLWAKWFYRFLFVIMILVLTGMVGHELRMAK